MYSKESLVGKKLAVLGYNEDCAEYARWLRSEGIEVVIGLRELDTMWPQAERDGFRVLDFWRAVEAADIIQVWQ